jgi:adenine deaminase
VWRTMHTMWSLSAAPYERVVQNLDLLGDCVRRMGGIEQAFMYLSFLTLTVVPELRLTEQGLYDVTAHERVPLFYSG